jgi:hypothetical protein
LIWNYLKTKYNSGFSKSKWITEKCQYEQVNVYEIHFTNYCAGISIMSSHPWDFLCQEHLSPDLLIAYGSIKLRFLSKFYLFWKTCLMMPSVTPLCLLTPSFSLQSSWQIIYWICLFAYCLFALVDYKASKSLLLTCWISSAKTVPAIWFTKPFV